MSESAVIAACLSCASWAACHRPSQPRAESPKDSRSYSLGYQTGANLKTRRSRSSSDDYLAGYGTPSSTPSPG
jgi:hypothetical protein